MNEDADLDTGEQDDAMTAAIADALLNDTTVKPNDSRRRLEALLEERRLNKELFDDYDA